MNNLYMVGTAWLFHVGEIYYVTHDFNDDLCDLSFEAVPIDELIAEPVKQLCNKGYITTHSCSGHPFACCTYRIIEAEEEKKKIIANEHVKVTPLLDSNVLVVCDLEHTYEDEIYIAFQAEPGFLSIPKGWHYSDALRFNIHADSVMGFYTQAISAITVLLDWIQSLPQKCPVDI